MPTKKRHTKNLNLDFELPPTTLSKHANLSNTKSRKHKPRTNHISTETSYLEDDTPKAFARLMAAGGNKRKRGGEEDVGAPRDKKRPNNNNSNKNNDVHVRGGKGDVSTLKAKAKGNQSTAQKPSLQILPGESLRAFNRRVDASMPIPLKPSKSALTKAEKSALLSTSKNGGKTPQLEDAEEEEDYSDYLSDSSSTYSVDSRGDPRPKTFHPRAPRPKKRAPGGQKKPKTKKQRGPSPDPFAVLLEKRGGIKFGETAAAPPELKVRPKEVLKARGMGGVGVDGGGIPKAVGSLARREMLVEERRSVVEKYREMMEGKRAIGGA